MHAADDAMVFDRSGSDRSPRSRSRKLDRAFQSDGALRNGQFHKILFSVFLNIFMKF